MSHLFERGPGAEPLLLIGCTASTIHGFVMVAAYWMAARAGLAASWIFGTLGALLVFTFDASAPYFGLGLFVTGVAFALATYAWRTALAGRPLMRDALLSWLSYRALFDYSRKPVRRAQASTAARSPVSRRERRTTWLSTLDSGLSTLDGAALPLRQSCA